MHNDKRLNVHPLLKLLFNEAELRGIGTDEMCLLHLDISRTYFVALVNGNRRLDTLSPKSLRNFAKFLRRPLPEVELLAGTKIPSDFFTHEDLDDRLLTIYRQMTLDPSFNHLVTFPIKVWSKLPQEVRVAFSVLYESYSNQKLLDYAKLPQMPRHDDRIPTIESDKGSAAG